MTSLYTSFDEMETHVQALLVCLKWRRKAAEDYNTTEIRHLMAEETMRIIRSKERVIHDAITSMPCWYKLVIAHCPDNRTPIQWLRYLGLEEPYLHALDTQENLQYPHDDPYKIRSDFIHLAEHFLCTTYNGDNS